ncbi:MAG: hypothetical protein AAFX40_04200 [Cyanobacteria bacterium J06639_1]
MRITQDVRCPNCGSTARKHELSDIADAAVRCPSNRETQLECPTCDYLIVTCSLNGAVVEAYAPGLSGMPRPHTASVTPFTTFVPPRIAPSAAPLLRT